MLKKFLVLGAVLLLATAAHAQEKHAFENEVRNLVLQDSLIKNRKDLILFTGSSSIRMWADLEKDFPRKNVLNRGFGGSTMRDLLYFADQLIIPYQPKTIFIYEGDNDIALGRESQEILASADSLLNLIRTHLPKTLKVYFIAAKPSVARWHLKDQYIAFNNELKTWTQSRKNVYFIDVWSPMLHADGSLKKELFLEDGLHMNRSGYTIWRNQIRKHLK
ncbi:MAG TPA: SGNH/GDSL hydrolase family protein [Cyclobacteriaceae bacterium]|nr:SGNH/GDSL hydrolase family protein [Cyclobacteriaceae bacterium]